MNSAISSAVTFYNKLAYFLITRIYLIDITKKSNEIIFTVEDHFQNYEVVLDNNSMKCSCPMYRNKICVCKHIKFILEKIDQIDKKSKSYNELGTTSKIFYIDIKKQLDPSKFKSDSNPRYKEYKILHDNDYSGKCCICLQKLDKKIIRCKHCNKYYHDECIYGWLRYGIACTCPNCREQWI